MTKSILSDDALIETLTEAARIWNRPNYEADGVLVGGSSRSSGAYTMGEHVPSLIDRFETVTAERDAFHAEIARRDLQDCRCRGVGIFVPHCTYCGDSTYDHDCPPPEKCVDEKCISARVIVSDWKRKQTREKK